MIEVNEQLAYIKHFLKKEKPSIADVVECYLTAADLYLQLEDADKVIECLTATENQCSPITTAFCLESIHLNR